MKISLRVMMVLKAWLLQKLSTIWIHLTRMKILTMACCGIWNIPLSKKDDCIITLPCFHLWILDPRVLLMTETRFFSLEARSKLTEGRSLNMNIFFITITSHYKHTTNNTLRRSCIRGCPGVITTDLVSRCLFNISGGRVNSVSWSFFLFSLSLSTPIRTCKWCLTMLRYTVRRRCLVCHVIPW